MGRNSQGGGEMMAKPSVRLWVRFCAALDGVRWVHGG